MFVRYQSPTPDHRGRHLGLFMLANELGRTGVLSVDEHTLWREQNDWYDAAYPNPTELGDPAYDRELHPLAAAWFKDTATHLLERIPRHLGLLDAHAVPYERLESADPGRVIYEDEVQVVVVPR